MRKSRYTDSQILAILKQNENGVPVPDLCREHGMSTAMFDKWHAKFGGMDASMMKRLKELKDENKRLKKMCNDPALSAQVRPLMHMPQRVFSSPTPGEDVGCCTSRSSR